MIRIIASRTADGFSFQLDQNSIPALEKSLGRKVYNTRIGISDDTLAVFPADLLDQVRLMFWLEDARRLAWEIVDPQGQVLRSSR